MFFFQEKSSYYISHDDFFQELKFVQAQIYFFAVRFLNHF